jgi:hypothetical protein
MTSSKISTRPASAVILRSAFEVAGRGRDAAHVADHRLDDDAGDLVGMRGEGGLDCGEIVEGQREGEVDDLLRHAPPSRGCQRSPLPSRP